jgi:DNA polymerase-3 subunit delta
MEEQQLRKCAAQGREGVYILAGDEDYLKRYYRNEFRKSVVTDESFAVFNHIRFDGAELRAAELLDALEAPPMMAEVKLVEWTGLDLSLLKDKALEEFAELLARPFPGNVLLITVPPGKLDMGSKKHPSRILTRLSKVAEVVDLPHATESQLYSWLARHFAAEGLRLLSGAETAFVGKAGHSMTVLSHEVEKVAAYAHAHGITEIDDKTVLFLVSGTVETGAFSLTEALLDLSLEDAYQYLGDLKRRKNEPVAILGQITKMYTDLYNVAVLAEEGHQPKDIAKITKMHEYRAGLYHRAAKRYGISVLRRVIDLCGEADLLLKRSYGRWEPLERILALIGAAGVR